MPVSDAAPEMDPPDEDDNSSDLDGSAKSGSVSGKGENDAEDQSEAANLNVDEEFSRDAMPFSRDAFPASGAPNPRESSHEDFSKDVRTVRRMSMKVQGKMLNPGTLKMLRSETERIDEEGEESSNKRLSTRSSLNIRDEDGRSKRGSKRDSTMDDDLLDFSRYKYHRCLIHLLHF